jgi:glucan-binding YG repeat protein
MNKKIKRIIAIALTISTFSIIEPSKYLNLMTLKAYADVRVKGADLEKISLGNGGIDFNASKTDYTLQLDASIDQLKVAATPKESTAKVTINGNQVYESDDYKTVVNLDKGLNKVTIDIENGSKKRTYTISVMRGTIVEDQIYLNNISLSDGDINFSQKQTDYNVNVPVDTRDISIRAVPEDNNYDVEIDGVTATDDNNYKRTVTLQDGDNEVKIRIRDDDDHEQIYTLHINRGTTTTSTQASSNTTTNEQGTNGTNTGVVVAKGWVLNNGQWNYINEKGNKDTGWKQINSIWYYLDTDGIMKTDWQNVNGQWYYLDSNGGMKTGWIKNSDGKWYYLYDSGAMAKNTTISGYKLDSNGAWTK